MTCHLCLEAIPKGEPVAKRDVLVFKPNADEVIGHEYAHARCALRSTTSGWVLEPAPKEAA
jgi:hypothetical protein